LRTVSEIAMSISPLPKNVFQIVACIPAYNEEKTIADTIMRVRKFVDEVIVVDDGSKDSTASIAEQLGVTVIRNSHKGKGFALRTAFAHARELNPGIIVTLDADGQHNPAEIPVLVRPIEEERAEMTVGSRYLETSKTDIPTYRRLGLRIVDSLSKSSCNGIVNDTQCGFRAFSIKALDVVQTGDCDGFGVETEQLALVSKCGLRVEEVPVTVLYKGLYKTSKRHPLLHGFELVISSFRLLMKQRPLLVLGVPGLLLLLVGIVTGGGLLGEFNLSGVFSIPLAISSLGSLSLGILLSMASIIFYATVKSRN
jgi:glycosyltransferase involved in cell wall biosynthesis